MSNYDPKDPFYRRAKKDNLRARSAFKIDELQQRFRLARTGDAVLDLGAAPGGFLQILAAAVGQNGRVVGVDIVPIRRLGGVVETLTADVFAPTLLSDIAIRLDRTHVDLVASDLAPKTSGIRDADEAKSLRLVERALELAHALLKPGGHFVAKVFMGGDFEILLKQLKTDFEDVKVARPEATRTHSREAYVVCFRYRRRTSSSEKT